jgi:hypothetical protein
VESTTPSDSASSAGIPVVEQNRRKEQPAATEAPEQRDMFARSQRRKLPDERKSVTHKFSVGGHEGYIIVGMYEEGPRRNLHQNGQGRIHALGLHGRCSSFDLDRFAIRRAAPGSGRSLA